MLHDFCVQIFPVQPPVVVANLFEGRFACSLVVLHNVEDFAPVTSEVVVLEEEWRGELILVKSVLELSLKVAEVDRAKRWLILLDDGSVSCLPLVNEVLDKFAGLLLI